MMSDAQISDSNALRSLQQASEARGLKFYVNPPREMVPGFLEDYEPDAIALGPEGGIIIEMKVRRNPASDRKLAAVAKRVASHQGWEFRVIYLNQPVDETLPIANPTPEQIRGTFREVEALTKGGHSAAALVTAWAALEALARLASAYSESRRSKNFSPDQAIQTLAEEGYIDNETADHMRKLAKLRNAAVHGDFSVNVSAEQVESLLTQLQAVASEVMTVTSEQEA
jgi:uncharacterized protein YutE (UPF0331/DUF86 family)